MNHVSIIIIITIFYSPYSEKKNRKYTGDYREQHGIEYGTKPKQFLNQCAVD